MAGRDPAPHYPTKRRRRNAPDELTPISPDGEVCGPGLPDGVLGTAKDGSRTSGTP